MEPIWLAAAFLIGAAILIGLSHFDDEPPMRMA
jgi:hypothetical protein